MDIKIMDIKIMEVKVMEVKILEILLVESSHSNTLQQHDRKWEGFEDSASMVSHYFDVCTLRELGAQGTHSPVCEFDGSWQVLAHYGYFGFYR
jgi:hypothetical protein